MPYRLPGLLELGFQELGRDPMLIYAHGEAVDVVIDYLGIDLVRHRGREFTLNTIAEFRFHHHDRSFDIRAHR